MDRTPVRPAASPQRTLAAQDARYAGLSPNVAPLPQTFWMPQANINGSSAYTPNRLYVAPLKGVSDNFTIAYALFGLGCADGFSVGHAIYRASFDPARGLVLRRVWSKWFDGQKSTEGGDPMGVGDAASIVLARTEQYFFAAVSDQPSPNPYVYAFTNALFPFGGTGSRYEYPVTRASDFPDELPGNHIKNDAEFVLGGYCFPTSFLSHSPTYNVMMTF